MFRKVLTLVVVAFFCLSSIGCTKQEQKKVQEVTKEVQKIFGIANVTSEFSVKITGRLKNCDMSAEQNLLNELRKDAKSAGGTIKITPDAWLNGKMAKYTCIAKQQ